jgi:hypothetical protein
LTQLRGNIVPRTKELDNSIHSKSARSVFQRLSERTIADDPESDLRKCLVNDGRSLKQIEVPLLFMQPTYSSHDEVIVPVNRRSVVCSRHLKSRGVDPIVDNGDVVRQSELFFEREILVAFRDTDDLAGPTEQKPINRAMQEAFPEFPVMEIMNSMIGMDGPDITHPSRRESSVESCRTTMRVDQLRAGGSDGLRKLGEPAHREALRQAHGVMRNFSVAEFVHKITPRFTGNRYFESTCGQALRQSEDMLLATADGRIVNDEQNRLMHGHRDTFL